MDNTENIAEPASHVRYPEGHVLLRNLSRALPVVSHGEGIYLFDATGKRYVDASSGALVASLGHGRKDIAQAIAAQLERVAYVNGTQFTSTPTEALATRIAAKAPPSMGETRVAFLCSGSEVVEAAVKFARQLWVERGEPRRSKLIARAPSYHGNTLYALSLSGRPHYKKLYGPMLSEVVTTPAPYGYRSGLRDYATEGAAHYARLLSDTIQREGPDTIAAFICEPIIGSSAGAALPPPGYFEAVGQVCARHGILVIADEILCGWGRTGAYFASTQVGCAPDLVVLGKSLGGGYAPLSALVARRSHVDELQRGTGYFMHAQTYLQAPFLTAAGIAALDIMESSDLVGNAGRVGAHLQQRLREALLPISGVGHVSGLGLLAGVELVADRATQRPFARASKVAERVVAALFDAGVIVWPNVGHVDGVDGDLFMVAPPLTITASEIDALVDTIALALRAQLGALDAR